MSRTQANPAPSVDFLLDDPAVAKDPGAFFAQLRGCPVARTEAHEGFWILSRYSDVQAAALRTTAFSSAAGVTIPPAPNPPALCLEQDEPQHRTFRRPMQSWFSPARMALLEDSIRALVDDLIDDILAAGTADLGRALAEPVPPVVIALLLGLPEADWPWFRARNEAFLVKASAGDMAGSAAEVQELFGYLAARLAERRQEPADDMLTDILGIDTEGKAISDAEAASLAFLILAAGHETTVGAIGGLLYHVAADVDTRDALIADPALVGAAVEEALRLEPPLMGLGRILTEDTVVADVTMSAGERVMLMYGAANRDPEVFTDPERFLLDRPHNRHLGFGFGIHRCVGAPLARLEMRVVLEQVLRRLPGITLVNPDAVGVGYHFARAYQDLHVRW